MKTVNFLKKITIICSLIILSLIVYGYIVIPDEICTAADEPCEISGIYTISFDKYDYTEANNDVENVNSEVKLFNKIPVKTTNTRISKRDYVVPSGEIFGIRIFSKGVLIVSCDSVVSEGKELNPSKKAGIKSGDLIITIDKKSVTSAKEISEIISTGNGQTAEIVYVRGGKEYTTYFTPVLCDNDGKYKAGWWIKDSAAGIGTMTFYDKESGIYGGLGHGICDTDTSMLLPLYYGDIVNAEISGCFKGKSGKAGELCGSFSSGKTGTIFKNSDVGVYGVLDSMNKFKEEIPVAFPSEIRTGKATILCTVNKEGVKEFEIEIEKIDVRDDSSKNLVIKVTDEKLISETGGIVQGMSGSPIIQNGMLVGAVTHVLINDPGKGYGIFAQNMINTALENLNYDTDIAS